MNGAILLPADCDDPVVVGGKAASLGDLVRRGFDVPPFVAVTAHAFGPAGQLPASLGRRLGAALAQVGAEGPFAVRSSGLQEDGAEHSHAGQFESVLNVPQEGLAAAVKRVAASGHAEGVRGYRELKGLGGAARLAVVVQTMVQPRAAGVMFTVDPVRGRRDRVVISAVEGLADRLVGGEVTGADYELRKGSGAVERRPQKGMLTDRDLDQLHDLALRIEATFGPGQDVEWALAGERLLVLQRRPVTALPEPEPESEPGPGPVSDPARTILDNSNIVESYPGLVSPLTFSFATHVYARVYRTFLGLVGVSPALIRENGAVLDNMLARVDGRVYYNLINWYRALALLPGFSWNRRSMETMMGVSEPLPSDWVREIEAGLAGGSRVREAARSAKAAAFLAWHALRLPATRRSFQRRLDWILAGHAGPVEGMSLSELVALYRRIEAQMLDRWDAPLINDFLCMAAFGASRRLMERWCGREGLAYHNDVMIGQGDIISAEPAQRILAMGELARRLGAADPALLEDLAAGRSSSLARAHELGEEVRRYLERFGDRCVQELKLESITLTADPSPLLAAIAATGRSRRSEAPVRERDLGRRLSDLFAGRPFRRWVAAGLVSYAKARVRDRENLRFERTRIFGLARRVFLAIGGQLHALGHMDDARDVLLLTVPEVLGFVEGNAVTADLRGLVEVRRRERDSDAALPDPSERLEARGAVRALRPERDAADAVAGPSTRSGTGCSVGRVRGVAKVVRDPAGESVSAGEILIARHTDPGWIALFANAAAIVVERGSLLSHSAIVARELGIPCVVGLRDATGWIKSGDTISVDGSTGEVRILPAVEQAA